MAKTKKIKNFSADAAGLKISKTEMKKMKMRGAAPVLLQVLPSLESGGVERGTIDIAKAAKKAGFISIVASEGGALVQELEKAEIRHIELPLASKNLLTMWANIRRIRKLIEKHRVDIVHARSRAPAWSAYCAAKKAGSHFITTFHGTYSMGGTGKKCYNSVMVKGKKVIAISEFIKSYMKENFNITDERIVVIPRGVDLDYFDPEKVDIERMAQVERYLRPHKDFPVIFVPARLTEWKGQEFILNGLGKLKTYEYTLVFAGKRKKHGSYLERLIELKEKYGLRGNVSIVDPIADMPAAYKRADIVISASLKPEAFGRVAAEAQAMGTPIIATNLGGSKEVVNHGKTGWLIEPGDEDALAKKLEELLAMTPAKRNSLGRKSRTHIAENFSLAQMEEKTIGLYREILSGE